MEKGRLSSENLFLYKNEILQEKRVERERERERTIVVWWKDIKLLNVKKDRIKD